MKPAIYPYLKPAALAAILTAVLAGCQSEGPDPAGGPEIDFDILVKEASAVRTRVDTTYITSVYDTDFYIELNTGSEREQETYVVAPGKEGRLDAKYENKTLQWKDLTSAHTFYGWTLPWLKSTADGEGTDKQQEIDGFDGRDNHGKYLTVQFEDTTDETVNSQEGHADNNSVLEKFIGTKAGPYIYTQHGKYVSLTFRHLVSKIKIGQIALIEPGGTVHKEIKAEMMFIGMPKTARFYPHPDDHGHPFVRYTDLPENDGVTYYIGNNFGKADYFYICPELDFKELKFKIKVKDSQFGDHGDYYGSFEDVTFERVAGTDYDLGGDDTVLHAGEMMTLDIVLIPGTGPGISLIIEGWNTDSPEESIYRFRPGIYNESELREMLDAFLNQKNQGGTTEEEIRRLFELYGEEKDIDGNGTKEKVFPLFDNVDISGDPNGNIFPIPKDYILDGMGHTITMKTNSGYNSDFNGTKTYFNIGPARDVWLSDASGNNKIYIDAKGYVWYYDENGNFTKGEQLPPLEGDYKSYDISVDGIIHRSTYYNNNITGS